MFLQCKHEKGKLDELYWAIIERTYHITDWLSHVKVIAVINEILHVLCDQMSPVIRDNPIRLLLYYKENTFVKVDPNAHDALFLTSQIEFVMNYYKFVYFLAREIKTHMFVLRNCHSSTAKMIKIEFIIYIMNSGFFDIISRVISLFFQFSGFLGKQLTENLKFILRNQKNQLLEKIWLQLFDNSKAYYEFMATHIHLHSGK